MNFKLNAPIALMVCGALWSGLPVRANQALAQRKHCMTCHSIDKKIVGPAFKDVASKYKTQRNAADMLAEKVIKGGAGVWGPVSMSANPHVSEAEAKALATWVLSIQ